MENEKMFKVTPPKKSLVTKGFKRFSLKLFYNKKSFSFTLGEVLVVLSIIGVLATLTIRSAVYSYEKVYILTKFKVAYQMLTEAVRLSESENGDVKKWLFTPTNPIKWDYANSKRFAQKYMTPYLDVAYECDPNNKDMNRRCYSKGKKDYWYSSGGSQLGSLWAYGPISTYSVRLRNGMSVGFQPMYVPSWHQNYAMVVVDIDGPDRGGAILGRDVFIFSIGAKEGSAGVYTKTYEFLPGLTCISGSPILYTNCSQGACKAIHEKGQAGFCGAKYGCDCSVDIVKNGFKFPKTYPLNKIPNKPVVEYD